MSQSPLDDVVNAQAESYRQGWRALNRLLHEGRSFSGNEKNCAFLNCGQDASGKQLPFADISSAIGFDFAEDGRGLAFVDWDFDGDLDVWITNRTAPRVRLLRNNHSTKSNFLSVRLQGNGTTTNRDAIGARLELHVAGESTPRVKSLHAGHSFLSQSSRWLHFGLGSSDHLEKLVVYWPAGGKQVFPNPKTNQFLKLTQNKPAATWTPPTQPIKLVHSTPEPTPPTARARIIVPPGMRLPPLLTLDAERKPQPLTRANEGLLLVNLWSSLCLPCQDELGSWAKDAELFRQANIEVIALLTDGAGDPDLTGAKRIIAETKFPFPWAETTPVTVRNLDTFHAATVDLWNPLPVPSSFLIDAKGEAIAIYTGPVEAAQVVADAKLASVTPEARRDAAIPFPGRWILPPIKGDSLRVANQLVDRGETDLAISYLRSLRPTQASKKEGTASERSLGNAHYLLGILLGQKLHLTEAMQQLEAARALLTDDQRIQDEIKRIRFLMSDHKTVLASLINAVKAQPDDLAVRQELGILHLRLGQYPEASEQLSKVVNRDPKRSLARYHLANALLETKRPAEAIAHLKTTLSKEPRFLDAANRLAEVLATHPDEKVRSTRESLALASRLCQMTNNQNPRYLDTLATAYAANGQFEKAVESARNALTLYKQNPAFASSAAALESRLTLFNAKKPYLESRWSPAQ